jgi:hypothetical protein
MTLQNDTISKEKKGHTLLTILCFEIQTNYVSFVAEEKAYANDWIFFLYTVIIFAVAK